MPLCASCGGTVSEGALCPHHHDAPSDGTFNAAGNRILCDLVHRGIRPRRLSAEEREPLETESEHPVPADPGW